MIEISFKISSKIKFIIFFFFALLAAVLEASENIMSNHSSDSRMSKKSQINSIHTKARLSPYPGSMTQRFKVPDNLVSWEVKFISYSFYVIYAVRKNYIHLCVISQSHNSV